MLGPPGQNWSAHVPQDLESRPAFYSRVSWQKGHPVNHISSNFDPGRSINTIERSQSGARRGSNHQYHGMSGGPGGSCQQERSPHGQTQPTNGQGRGRLTKFNNRIPLPRPPYDVNRNHHLPEEFERLTHSNRARPYLTSVPNSGSDIHFSDRSYNKDRWNVYPTSRFQMREPPNLDNNPWRSTMVTPPEMPSYTYSMPYGPSMPLPPITPTPHNEAIQDDQDDIEITLGPEQESTSAFASAGASEFADKSRDKLREQLEFYFSPSNLAVDTFLVSHMNAERFVSISVIADFKRVKAVTRNMGEIVAALRRSSVVIVDETGTMVKPVPARPRTTLIIRDLPYDTEAKEISDLFEVAQCPAKEIVKEVGNTWFVEFETPEEALSMLSYIRGKTLRGVPLAGRLKSNTVFTGGINNAAMPKHPIEQTSSSPTELNEYGPTLDGGWISSSDTVHYSPPFGRPTYRRFPLEPEKYSPYSPQGTWHSTATEFPFYDILSPTIDPAKAGPEAAQQGLRPLPGVPYYQGQQWLHPGPYMMSPHLPPSFGRPTERPSGQFAPTQGPPRRNSDSSHSSIYGRNQRFDKGGPNGPRLDSNSSTNNNNNGNSYRSFARRSSFSSDQLRREHGPRNLPLFSMNIRDQERQLQMVATPSGNTAAVMTQEAHGSETHGQDTQPPWIETPAQPAPSKSKNKNRKKKNQNQKKKATNQENKDAPDPIATVTKKLSDMTASEDKSAQPSQHDLRHKRGNDNISNATSNPNSRPHNHKNNKSSKGKDTKQHKKEKGSDISRDSPILQIENFPPLSSSYLPTTSYSQVRHQDSSVTRSQTAKKTKWQPLAYEAVTKPQKKQHNPEERVPHVDGVAEQHTGPARVNKAHPDGSGASSAVAPKKASKVPPLWSKPVLIPSANDKDDTRIVPGSIGENSDTNTTTVATSITITITATTTTTPSTTTIAPPKAMTAPTSPVMSYASILKRPLECHHSEPTSEAGVEEKEERLSSQ